jgi:hypothetical protein
MRCFQSPMAVDVMVVLYKIIAAINQHQLTSPGPDPALKLKLPDRFRTPNLYS